MKRSRSIELALMGSVPLLLAGCGHAQNHNALMYENLQQCIADGQVPAVTCEEGYERSLLAEDQAPHYGTLASCEAEYGDGQCRVHAGGGGWFVPMAAGFLIARALDHDHYYAYGSGWSAYSGGWSGHAGWVGQPVYRVRGDRGEWRTLSGERFGWGARGPGAHTVTETLSRGGFGRAAAARGSWGG
jgi:uncharacterized protein YgiB involved in biofilm formation